MGTGPIPTSRSVSEVMVETVIKPPLKPGFDFEFARRYNMTLEAPAIYRSVTTTVPAESMEVGCA